MKLIYRQLEKRSLRFMLHPWCWQLTGGLFLSLLMIILALSAPQYEDRIAGLRESPLSLTYVNEPPAIVPLAALLAPGRSDRSDPGNDPFAADDPFQAEPADAAPVSQPYHYLGTDNQGRDILLSLMQGARTALGGALLAVTIALVIGLPLGIVGGYYEGPWQRVADFLAAILTTLPKLLFLIVVVATLGFDFTVVMGTIGFLGAPRIMEVIRNKILLLKEMQFIEAARELGLSDWTIIWKHILWYNCRGILLVQLTYEIGEVILLETSLSYIGFGVMDQLSWGGMVSTGMAYIFNRQYWMLFFPTFTIVLAIAGFMLLSEGINKHFVSKQG